MRAHALTHRGGIPAITVQTPPRRTRAKELRRQALIDAATAVFSEHGYDAATTREIADRAGCAEGLIHRYFSGKRGLLLAIIASKPKRLVQEFETLLPDCASVQEEVERILLKDLDVMWERRDFMRVAFSQAAIDPEIGRSIRDSIQQHYARLITGKLKRHQETGRVLPDVNVEAVATALTGLAFSLGFVYQVVFAGSRAEARRVAQEAARVIARGVAPPLERRPQEMGRPGP